MPAERDEMETPQIAVETLGGDAAEAPQEALDLAVAAGGRLDVHGPAHPFAGGAMAATGVGDEQGVRGDHRRQRPLHAVRVELRQGAAEGRGATVGGVACAVQVPLALAAFEREGRGGLDDPGEPVRRLPNRRQEAVAPAERRARRNPAAHRSPADGLALGKRRGEGQPPLLAVQPGQRRAGESAESPAAGLAAIAAQTARLAPGHRAAVSSSMLETQSRNCARSIVFSPWSMQVRTQYSTGACEVRTEPRFSI